MLSTASTSGRVQVQVAGAGVVPRMRSGRRASRAPINGEQAAQGRPHTSAMRGRLVGRGLAGQSILAASAGGWPAHRASALPRSMACRIARFATVTNVMAPARPAVVSKVADVGLKDAPLKSLFPPEIPPPGPVSPAAAAAPHADTHTPSTHLGARCQPAGGALTGQAAAAWPACMRLDACSPPMRARARALPQLPPSPKPWPPPDLDALPTWAGCAQAEGGHRGWRPGWPVHRSGAAGPRVGACCMPLRPAPPEGPRGRPTNRITEHQPRSRAVGMHGVAADVSHTADTALRQRAREGRPPPGPEPRPRHRFLGAGMKWTFTRAASGWAARWRPSRTRTETTSRCGGRPLQCSGGASSAAAIQRCRSPDASPGGRRLSRQQSCWPGPRGCMCVCVCAAAPSRVLWVRLWVRRRPAAFCGCAAAADGSARVLRLLPQPVPPHGQVRRAGEPAAQGGSGGRALFGQGICWGGMPGADVCS